MSIEVFSQGYASQYDLLYQDKDYEAECDFLEAIFGRSELQVKTILDLGCGTGGHAIPLARRGYQVTGLDRSEEMLERARYKARSAGVDVKFVQGDIRTFDLGRTFDATVSMFSVVCYLTSNADLAAAFRSVKHHLGPGDIFVFDGWHGPGVLTDRPKPCIKVVQNGRWRVVRFTEPTLDVASHTVDTLIKMWITEKERFLAEIDESHLMRFLFPQEIAYFLHVAGFRQVDLCPFMDLEGSLDDTCWHFTGCARA